MGIRLADIASWNTRIRALACCGLAPDAEALFEIMPMRSTSTWNIMITTYAQAGQLSKASMVFDATPAPDVVSCNAMLQAFIRCGDLHRAWAFFSMTLLKNIITWNIAVQAFGYRTVFALMPSWNVRTCNIVVTAYAKEGQLLHAWRTFVDIPHRDETAWNCIIQAFVTNGELRKAEKLFAMMPEHTILCWNAMIVTNMQSGNLEKSAALFKRMPHRDIISWNALLTGDTRDSCFISARKMFGRMPMWSIASWNALITAYAKSGQDRLALGAFHSMQLQGIREEMETLAILLGSCASLTDLSQGKLIHSCFNVRHLNLRLQTKKHSRTMVSSALINMYGRCGAIRDAQNVFETTQDANAVLWNAMLAAFAANGHFAKATSVFWDMVFQGLHPTTSTFSILLSMCSHAGLWSEGYTYFLSMKSDFHLQPSEDHFVCVVDLIGRSGWLGAAEELLQSMPFEPGEVARLALLGACSSHTEDHILPEAKLWTSMILISS
ncbi:pentatricopeptide repeat-containing protein At4g02750 [Selaginella moellendorffii]|nr:pentatricopeptide repeat-containing protein At4g02750 [Selaginella moellendorffii]|eukprot:XP_002985491.2 pentatricopeptide repeat-containing protein At4g02750 [Selaginella moellendorffii]